MRQSTALALIPPRTVRPFCAPAGLPDSAIGHPPIRVGLTVPGGLELGGIGRAMLYLIDAWNTMPDSPRWTLIDTRGPGRYATSALYLSRELCLLAVLKAINRIDLLHINVSGRGSTIRKLLLSEFATHLAIPTAVHLHDFDYDSDFAHRHPSMQSRVARMFQRARVVLVLGRRDLAIASDRMGCDPRRVVVVQNGVPDPGRFQVHRDDDQPLKILFVGHLDNRKGVPDLLDALASSELRHRSWRLIMAGGGEVARFRSEIRRRDLAGRIEIRGWLPHTDTYQLLREADIFVLPSHAEGMALSVLEAMAHGKAIIATPVGAHAEAVRHCDEALLVPPGCVRSLVAALTRLLDEPALRTALGHAARRRYLKNFEARIYAARIASAYALALSDFNETKTGNVAAFSPLVYASTERRS